MVLTDDEIRVLWAEAAKTAASHMAMAESFGRAVETAVVERLIADMPAGPFTLNGYPPGTEHSCLGMEMVADTFRDWLREKVKA